MLKYVLPTLKQLWGLTNDTEANKAAIKALQTKAEEQARTLERVILELQHLKVTEAHEREKMALRLENVLLRSERALPPGNATETTTTAELRGQVAVLQQQMENLTQRVEVLEG